MRTINDAFVDKVKNNPDLNAIIQLAANNPEKYLPEIRKDSIKIYYKGGRLLTINCSKVRNTITFEFDISYLLDNEKNIRFPELYKWLINNSKNPAEWLQHIPQLEKAMDFWLSCHPQNEIDLRQKLSTKYASGSSSIYYYCDSEYAVSKKDNPNYEKGFKFDIICAKKTNDNSLILSVIELKNGDKAISKKCGLYDHIISITRYFKFKANNEQTVNEIKKIIHNKNQLGFLQLVPAELVIDKMEILLAVANHKKAESENLNNEFWKVQEYWDNNCRELHDTMELRVLVSCNDNLKLEEACLLSEYLKKAE